MPSSHQLYNYPGQKFTRPMIPKRDNHIIYKGQTPQENFRFKTGKQDPKVLC